MSAHQSGFSLVICVAVSGLLAWGIMDCLQALNKTQEIFAMTASKHHLQQDLLRAVRQGKLQPLDSQCVALSSCDDNPEHRCFLIWEDYQTQTLDGNGLRLRQSFEWIVNARMQRDCAFLTKHKPSVRKRLVYQKWL